MKISEIIAAIETIQRNNEYQQTNAGAPVQRADVAELCRLTVRLALHVQQLEVELKKS